MKKFIASLFALGLSVQASADVIQFRTHIYESLDRLSELGIAKYDDSLAHLRLAEDMATTRPAKVLVREAVKELVKLSHGRIPSDDEKGPMNEVVNKLKKTLQLERIQFSRFSEGEINVVENFVLYSLFADRAPLVKVEYRGIARDLAMSLLVTYFMEPRAAKYDPDMKILIPEGAGDGSPRVVFVLPEEKIELPAKENSPEEINKKLGSLLPSNLPLQFRTKWHDDAAFVHLEIWNIEAVQVVEKSLRSTLVLGSGNIFLTNGANLLEFMHTRLIGMYTGGVGKFQAGINLAAGFLHNIEDKLRDNLSTARWLAATDETVKQMLQKETASTIAHMTANLERRLAQAKTAGHSEKLLDFEKERTAKWIANAQKKLNEALAKIDGAIANLESSAAYKAANEQRKASMRLALAEKTVKRNVTRLDTWLKGVVVGISLFYVVEGAIQWSRSQTKEEGEKIAQQYGVKAANNLLYAVPGVNSLAFAWNFVVGSIELGGDKIFDFDFPDLSTERGLNYLVDSATDIGLYLGGMTRFVFQRNNLVTKQRLLPLYKNENGFWSGVELKKLEVSLAKAKNNKEKGEAVKTYSQEVRAIGIKNLVVLYALKNENINESEYNLYLKDLEEKWVSPRVGYTSYLRLVADLN